MLAQTRARHVVAVAAPGVVAVALLLRVLLDVTARGTTAHKTDTQGLLNMPGFQVVVPRTRAARRS